MWDTYIYIYIWKPKAKCNLKNQTYWRHLTVNDFLSKSEFLLKGVKRYIYKTPENKPTIHTLLHTDTHRHTHIYLYVFMYLLIYSPTLSHKQETVLGHFFIGILLVWIYEFSFSYSGCHTKVKEPNLPNNLPQAGVIIVGCVPFLKVSALRQVSLDSKLVDSDLTWGSTTWNSESWVLIPFYYILLIYTYHRRE